MASDDAIIEDELTKQLSQLKRDLHMKGVKSLSRKHYGLAEMAVQKKRIKILKQQIEEMEPTVSMLYNSNHALKDNEMKGYLIYLLRLKEFFSREVKTKQEIILQREEQIKKLVVKLCAMRNEYAKKKRSLPVKPVEFIQLENMSNRMNQMEKRICSLQHENKEIREKILDMRKFQRQYKTFEKDLRDKINCTTEETQKHLDRSVTTYEDREELMNKSKVYQERCVQDLRKAAVNENSLNLIREKIGIFEELVNLQNQARHDSRVALTAELIDQGVTGLESTLKQVQDLHSAIVSSSGKKTPEEMEDSFKLAEDQTNSVFSYLDELLKAIHHTQNTVNELKAKNTTYLMSLTTEERKLRWEIEKTQMKAEESAYEADDAVEIQNNTREELDILLEKLKSLSIVCSKKHIQLGKEIKPEVKEEIETTEIKDAEEEDGEGIKNSSAVFFEDAQSSNYEDKEIDDSNALESLEAIEKKILEYLMLVEYLRIKALPVDEAPAKLIGADEDLQIIDERPKLHPLDTLQPRRLGSQTDFLPEIDSGKLKCLFDLKELKPKAVAVVSKMESGRIIEDDDTQHINEERT